MVALCLGTHGDPTGVGVSNEFLMSEAPLYSCSRLLETALVNVDLSLGAAQREPRWGCVAAGLVVKTPL